MNAASAGHPLPSETVRIVNEPSPSPKTRRLESNSKNHNRPSHRPALWPHPRHHPQIAQQHHNRQRLMNLFAKQWNVKSASLHSRHAGVNSINSDDDALHRKNNPTHSPSRSVQARQLAYRATPKHPKNRLLSVEPVRPMSFCLYPPRCHKP